MGKINASKLVDSDTMAGELLLETLSRTINHKAENFYEDNRDPETEQIMLDVELKINGREFPFIEIINEWDKQVDKIVLKQAKELIEDQMYEIDNLFSDLKERLTYEIDKRLEDWMQLIHKLR